MRERIAHKLRDSGGVTILMALFAMLVASLVCVVILGASVTAVKQAKVDQAHEQSTLALQSAGVLLRAQIAETNGLKLTGTGSGGSVSYSPSPANVSNAVSNTLEAMAKQTLNPAGASVENRRTLTVSASVNSESSEASMPPVQAELVLKPYTPPSSGSDPSPLASTGEDSGSYTLYVTLSVTDAERDPQYLYLQFVGATRVIDVEQGQVHQDGSKDPDTYIATFKWGTPSFYLAEDVVSNG